MHDNLGPCLNLRPPFPTSLGKRRSSPSAALVRRYSYLHSASGETEWIRFTSSLPSTSLFICRRTRVLPPRGPGAVRDIYDYAWHYVDLIHELKLGPIPIVGFSLGGWTGVELGILRPQLVRKLVMVAAAGIRVPGHRWASCSLTISTKLRQLLFFDQNDPSIPLAMPTSLDDPRIVMWLRVREATARVAWNPYLHNPPLAASAPHRMSHTIVMGSARQAAAAGDG